MDYKMVFGAIATIVGFVSYLIYYKSIFFAKGQRTKPHVFSWFAWALASSFAFYAQYTSGAGAGAWVTGLTAMNGIVLTIVSLFFGEKDIRWTDVVCFIGALVGIAYWRLTDGIILPIILISLSDVIAFIPTYCKGWRKPYEDSPQAWTLASLKFAFGFFALGEYSIATVFYPATLLLDNGLFAVLLLARRWYLKKSK